MTTRNQSRHEATRPAKAEAGTSPVFVTHGPVATSPVQKVRSLTSAALLIAVSILAQCGCDLSPGSGDSAARVVAVFGAAGKGPGDFAYPRAIARAPDGAVFVIDKSGRVQRFTADGTFEKLWHMPEIDAGKPVGLSVHPDGRIFVADTHYHRVIVFDRDGNELARFGRSGTGEGEFIWPTDVAFDADGRIYVAEYNGNDRVTRFTPDLLFSDVVVAGPVNGRPMRRPSAIRIDKQQTLWVADACNHRILRFDLDGTLRTEFGEMGRDVGQMRYPYDLAILPDQTLLVCEYGNHRLQVFDPSGETLRTWGSAGREIGRLNSPWGACAAPDGTVYVLDSLNARVQVIRW